MRRKSLLLVKVSCCPKSLSGLPEDGIPPSFDVPSASPDVDGRTCEEVGRGKLGERFLCEGLKSGELRILVLARVAGDIRCEGKGEGEKRRCEGRLTVRRLKSIVPIDKS